jgi:hypothetical protein
MLGFKRFEHASITLSGIECVHESNKTNLMSSPVSPFVPLEHAPRRFGKQDWLPERRLHTYPRSSSVCELHQNRLIYPHVQLAPRAPVAHPMLPYAPLPRTVALEPGRIHDHMSRATAWSTRRSY